MECLSHIRVLRLPKVAVSWSRLPLQLEPALAFAFLLNITRCFYEAYFHKANCVPSQFYSFALFLAFKNIDVK